MTSLPKAMRRAVLTAKTLATAIAPEFKRTPLATGGTPKKPIPVGHPDRDANFKRWFSGSRVVDDGGAPKVHYHYTSAPDNFSKFRRSKHDIGMHFGTLGQAQDRMHYLRGRRTVENDGERVMPVYLKIKNPLRMRDLGRWDADNLAYGLKESGVFPDVRHFDSAAEVREFLKSKGYDGIVYRNTGETAGGHQFHEAEEAARREMVEAQKRRGKPVNSYDAEDQQTPEYKAHDAAYKARVRHSEENAEDSYIAFDPEQIKSAIGNAGYFDPKQGDITKASGGAVDGDDAPDDDSPYYSPLAQGLKGAKLETGPAAYWRNTISKLPGAAEAKDTGLHDFIDSQGGDIQKQALLEHLAMNSPQLQEHWFEEDPKRKLHENRPRFTDHTLDGGTNHKELSINLPDRGKENYLVPAAHRYSIGRSLLDTHPADVNRIAHVRMNDRRGPKGEKLLHIDELQSDWHQHGREKGYAGQQWIVRNAKSGHQAAAFRSEREANDYHTKLPESVRSMTKVHRIHDSAGVPMGPLKDTKQWTELALRRAIKHAADNGYHGVTWTTGEQQADRYDLSKQVDSIWHRKNPDGTFQVSAMKDERGYPLGDSISHEKLPDHVGKEIAEKIKNGDGKNVNLGGGGSSQEDPWRVLDGVDLKVGGEGMRKFYDEIVPSVANKIGREHGVQASKIRLPDPEEKNYTIMAPHGGVGQHHLFHGDDPVTSSIHREALERHRDRLLEAHDVHYLPVTPSMAGKKVRKYRRGGTVKPELGPAMMIAANVLNRKKRGQ